MKKQWLAVLISVGVIVGMHLLGLPIADAAREAISPVGRKLTALGQSMGSKTRELKQLGSLSAENEKLRSENLELTQELISKGAIESENQQLREQLNFVKNSNLKLLGADIINFQPDLTRDTLRIDRGAKDGVRAGMAAVSGGVLVGVVDQVAANYSDILLLGDINFRVLTKTENNSATGIVKGQIGASVVMDRIPQSQTIEPQQLIVTSGHDGVFPPNLLIGKVSVVSQTNSGVFKSAQIIPIVNPKELKVVMVVIE